MIYLRIAKGTRLKTNFQDERAIIFAPRANTDIENECIWKYKLWFLTSVKYCLRFICSMYVKINKNYTCCIIVFFCKQGNMTSLLSAKNICFQAKQKFNQIAWLVFSTQVSILDGQMLLNKYEIIFCYTNNISSLKWPKL